MAIVSPGSAAAALRHLASWGLVGGPTQPIEITGVAGLAPLAERHRVTGVVLEALDDGAATHAPAALYEDLAERHRRLLQQSLMAEADLVFVARLFQAEGIEFRVLKGLATAHLDHPDPALRLTSDVDLLVRRGQLDAATEVLRPHVDHQYTVPDRARGWPNRYAKDRTMRLGSGGWIDLHHMLQSGYYGLALDSEAIFVGSTGFDLAGTQLFALDPSMRLFHAVLHAGMVHSVGMHSARDIPVMLDHIDPAPALRAAEAWKVDGLLARGILHTWNVLGLDRHEVVDWAEAVEPDVRQRLTLRFLSNSSHNEQWTGALCVAVRELPGYLWPLASPSQEYLVHYGRSRSAHVRRIRLRRRRNDVFVSR